MSDRDRIDRVLAAAKGFTANASEARSLLERGAGGEVAVEANMRDLDRMLIGLSDSEVMHGPCPRFDYVMRSAARARSAGPDASSGIGGAGQTLSDAG